MRPPLRKRLGIADRTVQTRDDRGAMARALMYPFALGGLLAIAAAGSGAEVGRFAVTATICWVAAGLLLAAYDALPEWSLTLFAAVGTGLLVWTVYAGGPSAQGVAPLFALPAAFAAYFMRKPETTGIVALGVGGYAAASLAGP